MHIFILYLPIELLLNASIHVLLNRIFSFTHVACIPVTLSNRLPTNSSSQYLFIGWTLKNIPAFHFSLQMSTDRDIYLSVNESAIFFYCNTVQEKGHSESGYIKQLYVTWQCEIIHAVLLGQILCFWTRSGVTNLKKHFCTEASTSGCK